MRPMRRFRRDYRLWLALQTALVDTRFAFILERLEELGQAFHGAFCLRANNAAPVSLEP